MLHLVTLGGVALYLDNGQAAQISGRRSIAVLAMLAVAGSRGITRDKLLAYLWPESDSEHGRNALSQVLFSIRRDLGRGDAVIGGVNLRLNPDGVSSDVQAFESAFASGAEEQAIQLYHGPFLDGFFLSNAPEFERWMEQERARIARLVHVTLVSLAGKAQRRGDLAGAVKAWRQLAEMEPLDGRTALALVRALAAAGDRAGAVRYAEAHASLLLSELNVQPDAALTDLVETVRGASASVVSPHVPISPTAVEGSAVPVLPATLSELPRSTASPPEALAGERHARRGHKYVRRAIGVAALLLVAAAGAAGLQWRRARRGEARLARAPATIVAVLPFAVRAPPELSYLSDGLADLLSRNLDGAGNLRSVDLHVVLGIATDTGPVADLARGNAIAGRFGASRFVLGEVVASGSSVRITATLYDRARTPVSVATATVEGKATDVLGLADRLSTELLAGQSKGVSGRLARTAAGTTSSLPAFKAYLDGELHTRRGEWALAVESFQQAVRADSLFALAFYRLSNSADWAGRRELIMPAAERAAMLRDRLSEHESRLVLANLAWRQARTDEAERLLRIDVHAYPDDVEAWYQLGELLFHDNSLRGRSFTEAREPFERVLSLRPNDREALLHLARIEAREGHRLGIDSVTRAALPGASPADAREIRALRAFALHDSVVEARLLHELADSDRSSLPILGWRVATFTGNLSGAARIYRLATENGQSKQLQADAWGALVLIEAGLGRRHAAARAIEAYGHTMGEARADELIDHAILALAPFSEESRDDVDGLRSALEVHASSMVDSGSATFRHAVIQEELCLAALLRVHSGDSTGALLASRALEHADDPPTLRASARACAASVRARTSARGKRPAEALSILLAQRREGVTDLPYEPGDRFLIAGLLHDLGRDAEAVNWYRSMNDIGIDEVPFMGPAALLAGELLERLGDKTRALACYTQFLELWRDADPGLRSVVLAARQRAESLRRGE